jgi:hypothetical protein
MAKLQIKDHTELEFMFKNSGRLPGGGEGRNKLEDALSVPNAPMMFPKVIQNIVREAIEPLLIGTSLLQRIDFQYGQTITFGATGALVAADIAEGQEYPEQTLQVGAGTVTANIGKSGVAVKVTDEMIRYSQFDVIGMHLRAAGRALARHKEVKIFNLIRSQGVTVFDNADPTLSLKGVTTGRDLAGAANGSVTMDDIFDAWAQIVMQGFMPNTLIMHPLTWTMFVKDATMRAFVLQNGGGSFFATWTGNPQGGFPGWKSSNAGGLGPSYGQNHVPAEGPSGLTPTSSDDQSQTQTGQTQLPSHAGFLGNLAIVVTPYIPFDAAKRLTDIYLCDRNELGFLVVDEDPTTEEFDDPRVDIRKIKIRERYALAMNNEGQGVAVLRNVKVVPNEITLPAQAQIDVAGAGISAIPAGTPVV